MRFYTGICITLAAIVIQVSCDCGTLAPSANPSDTIEDGTDADIFPWHVVIYGQYSRTIERRCSGSLISADVVITAADCIGELDVTQFFVTTNDYIHENWTEDSEVQKSRVETIHLLNGNEQLRVNESRETIAWLVLQNPFNITSSLEPVCLDLAQGQEAEELPSGLVGLITYWPTTDGSTRAQVKKAEILDSSHLHCAYILREELKKNITYYPSCARYSKHNETVYNFAGTTFYSQRNGRWYLRGIISGVYAIVHGNVLDNIVIFTNIKHYADKINRNGIMKTCGIEGTAANPLIANGDKAEFRNFPWHVAIYQKKFSGSHEQICGGSLISSNIVISAHASGGTQSAVIGEDWVLDCYFIITTKAVKNKRGSDCNSQTFMISQIECKANLISVDYSRTAAHCFYDEIMNQKQRASRFAVAAGKQYRLYNWPEKYTQKSAVKSIYLSAKYYGAAGLYAEDIAWLILQHPFNITTFVRPICLISDNWLAGEDLEIGQMGKVAGWGKNENDTSSLELQELHVPFVPHEQCLSKVPEDYKPFLSIDKFCAGYLNGSSLCGGDSGGGLAFKYSGRWYLRGVVSNGPRMVSGCGAHSYTAFTYVGRFNDELLRLFNVSSSDLNVE